MARVRCLGVVGASAALIAALVGCGGARHPRAVGLDQTAVHDDASTVVDQADGIVADPEGVAPAGRSAPSVDAGSEPSVDADDLLRQIDDLIRQADASLAAERESAATMGE